MARDAKVMIRLEENSKAELDSFAESMGLTTSALGAFIIGSWLHSQKQNARMQAQAEGIMIEKFKNFAPDEIAKMMGSVVGAMSATNSVKP